MAYTLKHSIPFSLTAWRVGKRLAFVGIRLTDSTLGEEGGTIAFCLQPSETQAYEIQDR